MQPVNGDNFRLKIGAAVITLETGFSFEYSAEEVPVATKDGGFVVDGKQVAAINFNAAFDKDTTVNQFFEILATLRAGTTVSWLFGADEVGSITQSGTGKITQANLDSQTGSATTWNARLAIDTATMTQGTVV